MNNKITIVTQLSKPVLTKAVGIILSNNPIVRYSKFIGIALIVLSIILFVYVFKAASYAPTLGVFAGTFFFFFKSIMAFFSVNKIAADDITYEKLIYEFTIQSINITGETFEAQLHWENINKVKETNSFFLIFQNTLAANILQKKDFSAEQLVIFRNFLHQIQHIQFED